jgi:hypothetical protein
MSEERGAELFRALHAIIDVVTNLNLRDLKAEAKASSSSSAEEGTSAKASARGKAKDPNSDWTEVAYNIVPITPSSTRPRFSQVVGSSSESPIVPPSRVALEATSLANYPALNPATVAAWAVRQPPVGVEYSRAYVSATSALCILRIFAIMPFISCMATYIGHLGHFVSLHVDILWKYSPQTRFLYQSVTSIRLSAMGRYWTRLHTRVDILALPQIH